MQENTFIVDRIIKSFLDKQFCPKKPVSKAWLSLNRNSSPIIVLEHRRSSPMLQDNDRR